MAIDFIIGYDCAPKRALTDAGIQQRLKANERAQLIIRMYREAGDERPPSQMGFEMTHRTPAGETTELVVVQNLLDMAQPLTEYAHHCQGCRPTATAGPMAAWASSSIPSAGRPNAG